MSQDSIVLTAKMQKLILENEGFAVELNNIRKENQHLKDELSLKDREIMRERELGTLIRDCVSRFANSGSADKLVAGCVNFLKNYFDCDGITFYLRGEWIGRKVQDDSHLEPQTFTEVYPVPFDSNMVTSQLTDLTELLQQMSYSQQLVKTLTSIDLRMVKNISTKSAYFCRLKHANHTYGYVLIEFLREKIIPTEGFLNISLELFTSYYSSLLMNKMLYDSFGAAKLQAYIDDMTKCLNGRKLTEDLIALNDVAYTLVAVDIDKFKFINDNYGHDVGDDVLRYFANKFQLYMSRLDGNAYRKGGDEFIGISHKPLTETIKAIEEMMMEVYEKDFVLANKSTFRITNSFGIYTKKFGESEEVVMKKADINLYISKETGRAKYTANQDVSINEVTS